VSSQKRGLIIYPAGSASEAFLLVPVSYANSEMTQPSRRIKLERAKQHLDGIKSILRRYLDRKPYEIITDEAGREHLRFTEQPPDELHILIGEFLYQVRSALDHAIFEVIGRNPTGATLPDRWEARCEFPIATKLPDKIERPPVPFTDFGKHYRLPGLSATAYAALEPLQPYYAKNIGGWLHTIQLLSNTDKHRRFNLTVGGISRLETFESPTETASVSDTGRDGTELRPLAEGDEVSVDRIVSPFITFHEANRLIRQNAPIEEVLQGILNFAAAVDWMSERW
jgi:hypothetical protein